MPEAIRYVCVAQLDGSRRFFFWESGDDAPDRVVVDQDGIVLAFPSEFAAREAASAEGQGVSSEDATVYDLDAIDAWCKASAEVHDCSELLNAWNLFGDLPRGNNLFGAADRRAEVIYDELFRGCNLPAITPPGVHYVPGWSASELAVLKRLLLLGLAEFRARLG